MPRTKINKSQPFPGVELAELCHRAEAEVTSLAEEEEQLLVRQSRSHLNCPWHWNSLAIPHPAPGLEHSYLENKLQLLPANLQMVE